MLLVHGWMFPSDLNWLHSYRPLRQAGYRVLAMDLRELGRFDSSAWVGKLTLPAAVLVMTSDRLVPPRKQLALAQRLGVEPVLLDADHDACSTRPAAFVSGLVTALRTVSLAGRLTAVDRPA